MSDPQKRFTGLYDEYYRRVLRYALQHAGPGSAEDIASETFLIAWRRLDDVPDPPLPWLLGVARNLLGQQFRHARRQQRLTQQIWELTTDADLRTWDAGEHVIERAVALEALDSLPDTDVEALTWSPGMAWRLPKRRPSSAARRTRSQPGCTGPGSGWPTRCGSQSSPVSTFR